MNYFIFIFKNLESYDNVQYLPNKCCLFWQASTCNAAHSLVKICFFALSPLLCNMLMLMHKSPSLSLSHYIPTLVMVLFSIDPNPRGQLRAPTQGVEISWQVYLETFCLGKHIPVSTSKHPRYFWEGLKIRFKEFSQWLWPAFRSSFSSFFCLLLHHSSSFLHQNNPNKGGNRQKHI